MADIDQNTANEQPLDSAGGPSDSGAGGKILEGGITPQVEAALAKLPAEEAAVIRADIVQKNSRVEEVQRKVAAQRQALERDVQLASVMREAMKDSEFQEFLDARSNDRLATYFREKARAHGYAEGTNGTTSNLLASEVDEGESAMPTDQSELAKRLEEIERRNLRAEQERILEKFASDHPDYEEYLPVMASLRSQNPGANLEVLYNAAVGLVERGVAQKAGNSQAKPAAAAQQEETLASGETASQTSPPLPVGSPPGATTPAQSPPSAIREAWEQAKSEMGLKGPLVFTPD